MHSQPAAAVSRAEVAAPHSGPHQQAPPEAAVRAVGALDAEVADAAILGAEADTGGGVASETRSEDVAPADDGQSPEHVHAHSTSGLITAIAPLPSAKPVGGLPLVPILLAVAAAAGVWLVRRRLRSSSSSGAGSPKRKQPRAAKQKAPQAAPPPEPIDPDGLATLVCGPPEGLPGPSAPAIAGLPLPLAGVRCCFSEDFDMSGTATTLGAPEAALPSGSTSAPVARILAVGASCIGKTAMQPLGVDLVGSNVGNPFNKAHIAGGGHTGVAICVHAVMVGIGELCGWWGVGDAPWRMTCGGAHSPSDKPASTGMHAAAC